MVLFFEIKTRFMLHPKQAAEIHAWPFISFFFFFFFQIKTLRKTPGSPPASISFELVEPGFPGFLKQHTRNAAYCSKLFKHSGGKKKGEAGARFPYLV